MAAQDPASLPTAEDRIRAATWFAGHNFGVFTVWSCDPATTWCRCPKGAACGSPGKHPISPKGFLDATRDPDTIRRLLSAGSEPNYGLVCPPGVFAWDVDGVDWAGQLARLTEQFGELPNTLTTQTANGVHMFWRWPDGLPIPAGEMFGWVTRWGAGRGAGYVIGPRSVHQSGAVYAPVAGAGLAVATLPMSWANGALGPSSGPTGHAGGLPPVGGAGPGYVLPDSVGEGGRYDAIVSYTAHLYNRGLTEEEMWPLVKDQLAPRFRVPLDNAALWDRFHRAVHDMAERLGPPLAVSGAARSTRQGGRPGGGDDDDMLLLDDSSGVFPEDPNPAAFRGLLGEFTEALAVDTDVSRVALLGCVLAYAGGLLPTRVDWHGVHTSSPFICLVGHSAVGRKGTAMRRAHEGWFDVIPAPTAQLPLTGLQSGEALVARLSKDPVHLLVEQEYARVLQINKREGTTLDHMLRTAFDGEALAQHKADDSRVVRPPYWLGALVAITPDELRARIAADAALTGSGNRWLYLATQRRAVAAGGHAPEIPLAMRTDLLDAQRIAAQRTLPVDDDVRSTLAEYAEHLRATTTGLTLRLTARLAVGALRLALVHAAADRAMTVGRDHLERALALTEYGRRSLPWVFGPVLGNPDTRTVYRMLHDPDRAASGLVWEVMRARLHHADRVQAAVDELQDLGLARIERQFQPRGGVPTGRPRRVLWATGVQLGSNAKHDFGLTPPAREGGASDNPENGTVRPDAAQDSGTVRPPVSGTDSGTDRAGLGTVSPPGSDTTGSSKEGAYQGVTPDGVLWCRDWVAHQMRHRDVAEGNPWCEVCVEELG